MEETKRCPHCGGEILLVAKKCKHCGEWIEQQSNPPTPPVINKVANSKGNIKLFFSRYGKMVGVAIIALIIIGCGTLYYFNSVKEKEGLEAADQAQKNAPTAAIHRKIDDFFNMKEGSERSTKELVNLYKEIFERYFQVKVEGKNLTREELIDLYEELHKQICDGMQTQWYE